MVARPPCLIRDRNSSLSPTATAHSIELCSHPTIGWKMRERICGTASMTRELPTRGFGGAATARRTQSRRVTPTAGKRRTTTKSPGRRREESKEATRGREPPSPAGKGAGRPVAWLAYSNSRPSDFSAPCSGHRKNEECSLSSRGREWGVRKRTAKWNSMIRLLV